MKTAHSIIYYVLLFYGVKMDKLAKIDVTMEEREPTQEELEIMAAKQLMIELQMIKRRIQESGTLLNGMLIMQVKFLLNGLMKKYHNLDLLKDEQVELKLTGRRINDTIQFKYSSGLQKLIDKVVRGEIERQKLDSEESPKTTI